MAMEFVVQLSDGCWLAAVDGDPGRTLRIENAQRWHTRLQASKALSTAKKENQHRHFSDSKVVPVEVTVKEI